MLFKVGLSRLVAQGTLDLPVVPTLLQEWHRQLETQECALFTGIAGPNRKLVLAMADRHCVKAFVKLPLSPQAETLIRQEANILGRLDRINRLPMRYSSLLSLRRLSGGQLAMSALSPTRQPDALEPLHWKAFCEWRQLTSSETRLGISTFWKKLNERFRQPVVLGAHKHFPLH